MLTISVEDSGAGAVPGGGRHSPGSGVGLANVSRRLQLCFGPGADVAMQQGAFGTKVQFSVPADRPANQPVAVP
jgi:LytS/YehU family sensor histidine kinase